MSDMLSTLQETYWDAFEEKRKAKDRGLPLGDLVSDRWEKAKRLGFGDSTSIYDTSVVLGDVTVGKNTWIGPYTILDGSGGLTIGDYVTISANTLISSHSSATHMLSGGKFPIERRETKIGNRVVIGPNSLIMLGVTIGDNVVIAPHSVVTRNVRDNAIIGGHPAKPIGKVVYDDEGYPQLVFNRKKEND